MNEKVYYGTVLAFSVATAVLIGASITRARTDSGRIGQLQSELDRTIEQLAESNRRSTELIENISTGLSDVSAAITDGTASISSRIRKVAEEVRSLEEQLDSYRNSSGSGNDNISSAGGE